MIDVSKLTPMRNDVVLRLKPVHQASNSLIYFKEQIDHTSMQYFTVLRVGPDVKHVNVGDTVVCSWKRITPPFDALHDGNQCKVGITSETEIDCVVV